LVSFKFDGGHPQTKLLFCMQFALAFQVEIPPLDMDNGMHVTFVVTDKEFTREEADDVLGHLVYAVNAFIKAQLGKSQRRHNLNPDNTPLTPSELKERTQFTPWP